jgi:hypothetical protein
MKYFSSFCLAILICLAPVLLIAAMPENDNQPSWNKAEEDPIAAFEEWEKSIGESKSGTADSSSSTLETEEETAGENSIGPAPWETETIELIAEEIEDPQPWETETSAPMAEDSEESPPWETETPAPMAQDSEESPPWETETPAPMAEDSEESPPWETETPTPMAQEIAEPAPWETEANKFEAVVTNTYADAFNKGYSLYEDNEFKEASPYFFNVINKKSDDDEQYEWAQFFFGVSLMKSGYSHAAIDILSNLVIRKPNPKIVSYILELFEQTSRSIPFDRDMITNKVLSDHEYGFVDKKLSNFVNYYQGVFDWEHGFLEWGNKHFNSITPDTYYHQRFKYHQALLRIYQNQTDKAIEILENILKSKVSDRILKDQIQLSLARLYYEKEEYKKADILYHKIGKLVVSESKNLLERAWVQYRLGNSERAMGLLYALTAPEYQDVTPEYFILKSFIYKDVCHYRSAMSVVDEFKDRFKGALDTIYQRGHPSDDIDLLQIILENKEIKRQWDFLSLLEKEKNKIKYFRDKHHSLYKYLAEIYQLRLTYGREQLQKQVAAEYESIANQLLSYEEEAHLMEYEIGLDMSQRSQQFHYKNNQEQDMEKQLSRVAIYPFQGEFWNDELDSLKVILPNKCNRTEEWDIFFK